MRTILNSEGEIISRFSTEGGLLTRLTNKTGASSVKGTIVIADTTTANAFDESGSEEEQAIGAIYEDGVADGSECWIGCGLRVQVILENGTLAAKGNWVHTAATAGRADATLSSPPGGGIPELDDHMQELGQSLQDVSAGGSITSITRVDTTATVTTSAAHTLTTGDEITVSGANEAEYNGTFTITVTDTDEFTYEVSGSPTTPATGTITYITINMLCWIMMHFN